MKLACVLLLALFATCALAQRVRVGPCPEVKTNPTPYDWSRFTGIWYALKRSAFAITANYTCVYGRYKYPSPNTFSIQLGGLDSEGNPATNPVYPGEIPDEKYGRVDIQITPTFTLPYWALDSDYDTFTSFYGCAPLNATHSSEVVFPMGRERHPPQATIDKALKAFVDQGISLEGLSPNDQFDCPVIKA